MWKKLMSQDSSTFRARRIFFASCGAIGAAFAMSSTSLHAEGVDVQKILIDADRYRGHLEIGVEYKVDLKCESKENGPTARSYTVRSKGEGASALTTAPDDKKDDLFLVNGRFIWDIRRTSKQPASVTLTSRLTGLASVGDIVAMGFGTIYDGTDDGTEKLDGKDLMRIKMKARPNQAATYESATVWIEPKTNLAHQVIFKNLGGRPVKTVHFSYNGKLALSKKETIPFVTESKVEDEFDHCVLTYSDFKLAKVQDDEFDVKKVMKKRGNTTGKK